MSDAGRFTDLEIRYTHLERLVDELSKVVYEERLARQKLDERVRELEHRARSTPSGEPVPDEPPPHY